MEWTMEWAMGFTAGGRHHCVLSVAQTIDIDANSKLM